MAHGAIHLVYVNKKGELTASGFAQECLNAFFGGAKAPSMGIVKHTRRGGGSKRLALLERDGDRCFYCGRPMPEGDQTIEHILALDRGGPNTLENLALAHSACNQLAANLALAKKIALRDRLRAEAGPSPTADIEQRLLGDVEGEDQSVGAVG